MAELESLLHCSFPQTPVSAAEHGETCRREGCVGQPLVPSARLVRLAVFSILVSWLGASAVLSPISVCAWRGEGCKMWSTG